MFRRFSKSASRKGKTAYKFKFTFELANLTGIPAHVDHAALTFVRGAKSQTSAVVPVEECAAVWHDARASRLELCVTLYKDSSGAFQTKEYALKAQGVTGAVDGATAANQQQRRKTFAKGVFDLASFALLDGTGVDADAELQYVPLESSTKGMPGTVAGLSVGCAWLRDAAPGEAPTADSNLPGSIRAGGGSEATELVFVGDAVVTKDAFGTDEVVEGDETRDPNAASLTVEHHEQDLEGFVVPGEDEIFDANETVEGIFAFPDATRASDDSLDVSGASASSRSDTRSNVDNNKLTPVREGTPGREHEVDNTEDSHENGSPDRTLEAETNVINTTQEVGAFAHEADAPFSRSPETPAPGASLPGHFQGSPPLDSHTEDATTPSLSSDDRTTPARVLVQRATAPLRDEIDALREKLAEAVTKVAVADSDATEQKAFARSLREELRLSIEEKAVAEERAKSLEAETVRLKAALLSYEGSIAKKDAAFAESEARAAEEALALSKEAAEAVEKVERATKESSSYRRKVETLEAMIAKMKADKKDKETIATNAKGSREEVRALHEELSSARLKLSSAASETASVTRAKDELHAECVTLRAKLKQSTLALKKADEAKERAIVETKRLLAETNDQSARKNNRPALREVSANDDLSDVSAKQVSVMKKLVEKLRFDLNKSEEINAKTTEALTFETKKRKDAEARAERLAKRADAAENAEKTVEPNRTCSLLPLW